VKIFRTSISDLSFAAATCVTNLGRSAEHLTRLNMTSDSEQRSPQAQASSLSSTVSLKLLQETVSMLRQLATSLEHARTEVLEALSQVKLPTISHITSDESNNHCQQLRW